VHVVLIVPVTAAQLGCGETTVVTFETVGIVAAGLQAPDMFERLVPAAVS
jgi:hypothetical protein